MRIYVTQNDIEHGIQRSPTLCPIALALKRRKVRFESVDTDGIRLITRKIPIPEHASWFIDSFDQEDTVRPFSFTIKL